MSRMKSRFIPLSGLALLALTCTPPVLADDVKELVEPCADCHGKNGVSTEAKVPTIAGFSYYYFLDSMIAYKNEERPCPETEYLSGDDKGDKTTMCEIADDFDEEEFEKMAKHFSELPFKAAKQDFDPKLAEKGEEVHEDSCEKCHADNGRSKEDDSGILAGQWTPYLKEAFRDYTSGDRPMVKKMKPKYEKLSDADKEALLHFYAREGTQGQ